MEEITKELNSATEYLRAMKRSGHHKGDCDNVMMHLANIEDLVNKLFIANVSGSLQSLQEWAKSEKDGQVQQILVMTAFGNTIVVDLTSKSSIKEFCEWQ